MLKNFRKVDVKKPARATPHGHVAFVRFGAETWGKYNKYENYAIGNP